MKKVLDLIAWLLVVVGALNWGLVGALDFNLVEALFGAGSTASMVVYILVGIGALWMVYAKLFKRHKK